MSGPGRGSGRRRRRRRRPKQSTILLLFFFFFVCVCVLFVASSLLFDRTGLYNVRNVRGFPRFFSFLEKTSFLREAGRSILPISIFCGWNGPVKHLLRRGFNTLLSTRKATRKISGDVAQMVERSLRTMSFPAGTNLFFFFLFFRGKEGDPPRPTQSVRRKTAEHTTHTHTHHHHPARRDETRRDETLARALDAIGEVVRGLLVSGAQPGFPHHQQQQHQRILSIHTHPP